MSLKNSFSGLKATPDIKIIIKITPKKELSCT